MQVDAPELTVSMPAACTQARKTVFKLTCMHTGMFMSVVLGKALLLIFVQFIICCLWHYSHWSRNDAAPLVRSTSESDLNNINMSISHITMSTFAVLMRLSLALAVAPVFASSLHKCTAAALVCSTTYYIPQLYTTIYYMRCQLL